MPYFAMIFTMALPTMAPSDMDAMALACSGVLMPKPIAQGTSVTVRMLSTMAGRSVLISLRTPVTPIELTT